MAAVSHCAHGDSKEGSDNGQSHSHGEPCTISFYAAIKPVTEKVSVSHSIIEFFSLIALLETKLLAPDYSLLARSSPDPWDPYVLKILSSLYLSPNAPPTIA